MNTEELAERDGWTCWICDQPIDPEAPPNSPRRGTVEHVIPRSRGGTNHPENLRLTHATCNHRRSNHLPELSWPPHLHPSMNVELWGALHSREKNPTEAQIVALVPASETETARTWLEEATGLVGAYTITTRKMGTLTALLIQTENREHAQNTPADEGVEKERAGSKRARNRRRR